MKKFILASALLTLPAFAAAQYTAVFEADFETDQSGDFTTISHSANDGADNAWNYQFDYVAAGIPEAPNSTVGDTNGLQMEVNLSEGAVAAVNAIVNVPGSAQPLEDYILQFDMYMSAPTEGASGTTEFAYYGSNDGAAVAYGGSADFNGFIFGNTGEGGASSDYVYYEGAGVGTAGYYSSFPRWWDTDTPPNMNNIDQDWLDFFDEATTGTDTEGSPRNIWITVEVEVKPDGAAISGSVVNVYYTAPGKPRELVTAPDLQVGLETNLAVGTDSPMVGYGDVFTSVATGDVYAVFDNIQVLVPDEPSSVNGWLLLQ